MMNDKKIDVKNFEYLNIETNGIKVPVITATGSTIETEQNIYCLDKMHDVSYTDKSLM